MISRLSIRVGAMAARATMPMRALGRTAGAAALLAATTVDAFAYLDPGTGSIILQGLIAAAAAAGVTARLYWGKITGFLRDPLNRNRDQQQEKDQPPNDDS